MKAAGSVSALLLLFLTSCQAVEAPPVKGKIVFNAVRSLEDAQLRGQAEDVAYLLSGGELVRLEKNLLYPTFSPDGKTIVACALKEKSIVLLSDSGEVIRKIQMDERAGEFLWKDGKTIIYTIIPPNTDRSVIKQMNLDTGQVSVLVDFVWRGSTMSHLYLSPQRDRIIFTGNLYGSDGMPEVFVYVCDVDGQNIRKVRQGVSGGWFPDGKHILFLTNSEPGGGDFGAIYKLNVESSEIKKIRNLDYLLFSKIRVSPDGKYIFLAKGSPSGGKTLQLWPIDGDGETIEITKPVRVGSDYSEDYNPDWFQG